MISPKAGILRFILIDAFIDVYIRSITTDTDGYLFAIFRMNTQLTFACCFISFLNSVFDTLMERSVEIADHIGPFFQALRYLIELLFYSGSKVVIHNVFEILDQEIIHNRANVCRE